MQFLEVGLEDVSAKGCGFGWLWTLKPKPQNMGFSDKGSVKSSVYFGIAASSLGVRMRILKVEVCGLGFRVQGLG